MKYSPDLAISPQSVKEFRSYILAWYDRHRRILPWRALEGEFSDPYKVWLSEIMLQQTTVAAVIPYFQRFTEKWPSVVDLANAPLEDVMQAWAGLGYYARARNLHKCASVIRDQYQGIFPRDIACLKSLPGVGDYTSAAIAAIAFGGEANVVDGNVERVMARYHACDVALPAAKPILKQIALYYTHGQTERTGDYAQALMDFGATICTPQSPTCGLCPVRGGCAALAQGIAADLPRRLAKKPLPQRFGNIYFISHPQKGVLLHQRPEKGLLGGMIGLPTSDWGMENKASPHPIWIKEESITPLNQYITHIFTHFKLRLDLFSIAWNKVSIPPEPSDHGYFWLPHAEIQNLKLPTVFRKAWDQGKDGSDGGGAS